jgi:hypothetical protein
MNQWLPWSVPGAVAAAAATGAAGAADADGTGAAAAVLADGVGDAAAAGAFSWNAYDDSTGCPSSETTRKATV